jgi:hypothetical protein
MTRHARAPRVSRPRLIVAIAVAVVVLAGATSAVVLSGRHHRAAFDAAAWSANASSSRQASAANPTMSASASGSPSGTPGSTAKAGQPPPARSTAGIWRPAPGTTWQWQIVDQIGPSLRNVQMYDVDLTDAVPVSTVVPVAGFGSATWPKGINAGIIGRLHAAGKVAICYLDTGAWESYEPDHALFPGQPGWSSGGASNDVIGNSTGWDNEYWLDIRAGRTGLFAPIQWARLDLAKSIGCDGIEPDENNPYGNNPGPAISLADEKAWYLEVARQAHARGLSVGMKNGVEVTDADTVAAFDWNLNEECFFYDECGVLDAFIRAGKAVFQTEYTDDWKSRGGSDPVKLAASNSFCPSARAHHFATLVKNQVPDDLFVTC